MLFRSDSIMAHGVNHIVWHGMPYNVPGGLDEFYAAVHVGPDAGFADELPAINDYLTRICQVMRDGTTHSQLAVYLPNEDNWMAGRIPPGERTPGANHRWEMRHVRVPAEAEGYHPLWVSETSLRQAQVADGCMQIGELRFAALLVDCEYVDLESLRLMNRLAEAGLPIVMKRPPKQPGHRSGPSFGTLLSSLFAQPSTTTSIAQLDIAPFFHTSGPLPLYWARRTTTGALFVFIAHPVARDISFPMRQGQCESAQPLELAAEFNWEGVAITTVLRFPRQGSVLLRLDPDGHVTTLDTAL